MQPHVGISGTRAFFGRHEGRVMIGSDATRVPDREAGRIQPSRFITKFLLGEMKRRHSHFGLVTMCIGGGMGAAGIFENLQ